MRWCAAAEALLVPTPVTRDRRMTDPVTLPVVAITPRDNGPYRVDGPVVLQDAEGGRWELPEGKEVSPCRCGHSQVKPFCDSSHRSSGFESVVRAAPAEG
jgi:CDGSH-type Zn-finger protein